jgi:AcrR family transcriptional regulator
VLRVAQYYELLLLLPDMSNKPRDPVRNSDPDPRVARTTSALGNALIELVRERDFRDITVQEILDRAGVGRTAFYAHYRNKEDVLHSSFEHLFNAFEIWLERPSPLGPRLFPVTELLTHMGEEHHLAEALRRSGKLDEFLSMCNGYAARCIERRLPSPEAVAGASNQLTSRMLAGALMESIVWWQDRRDAATPLQMDSAFHQLARGMFARTRKP